MKKAKSTQFQLLSIIIATIVLISLLVGGISMFEMNKYISQSNDTLLATVADKEAQEINAVLSGMEKSVHVMASYVLDFYDTEADLIDPEKRSYILNESALMFIDVAKYTERTVSYYLRFNPEFSDSTAGLRCVRNKDDDSFVKTLTTDLSKYSEDDKDAVGWYWQPYRSGEPVWMMPYHKEADGIMLVTYSMPLFYGEHFIGVVGMDFDYSELTAKIDEIKVNEKGYAFLKHDDHIAYHKDAALKDKAPDFSENYVEESRSLRNGMHLVVLADRDELANVRYKIELSLVVVTLFIAAVLIVVSVILVKRFFVKPLERLTESALKLTSGNYEVETVASRTKEVELLNVSFKKMAEQLCAHDKYQHRLAYRDALTGLRNSTSYKAWVDEFAEKIGNEISDFGVVVLDLNYLKETNDKYGHDIGNRILIAAARTISYTFKRSPVFRIGGDEFAVILQGHDLEEHKELMEIMHDKAKEERIALGENMVPVSIACGIAIYDPACDDGFDSVFKRADTKMYENKRAMKSASFV